MSEHEQEETMLERGLTCPRCNVRYVDPRIIEPCGETLCARCVEGLLAQNGQFDCFFCNVKHEMPENGFHPNTLIAQMLQVRQSSTSNNEDVILDATSPSVIQLQEKLNQIQTLTRQIQSKMENYKFIISEYCQDMRDEVNMVVDTKKRELEEMRDELVKKIEIQEQRQDN
jgi:hypothetical protein